MDILVYVMIAPITAGVGWFTNFLGIKMMFYPVEFVGIGQFFGWQGIIPRMRVRLTRNLVKISVEKICTPADVFDALEQADTVERLTRFLEPYIDDWVDDIMAEQDIPAWNIALPQVKALIYQRIRSELPRLADAMLEDIGERADRLVDISQLAEDRVRDNPQLLIDLFLNCAGKEMDFVIRSGLYFGLPLGCIQAFTWYFYPAPWVLPVFGVLAGAGTNWIALKMIAHPPEPRQIGPWTIQGLYLKRQAAVSEEFANVFVGNFMNAKSLLEHIWHGPKSAEVHRIVNRHLRRALEENWVTKVLTQVAMGKGEREDLQKFTANYAAERVIDTFDDPALDSEVTAPIRRLIAQRMAALSPREFQQLLLPAFEQDQLLIVFLGGVLGGSVGLAQFIWIFGGSF